MNSVIQKFNSLKDLFNKKLGSYEAIKDRLNVSQEQVITLTNKEDQLAKASLFLQSLSDSTRVQTIDKISQIVTDGLQVVKDKNLEFKMKLLVERGQPSLQMFVLDKLNNQEFDILNSLGGGIADICGFLLRVALLARWTPALSRIIIADESLKFVSVKDQEKLAEFIRTLCEKLNLQLILVTHSETISKASHKCFEVTKVEGVSHVTEKTDI